MIGYSRGKSFSSRMIQWFTWVGKSGPSHALWIEPDGKCFESWHLKDAKTGHNGARRGTVGDVHTPGTIIELYAIQMCACEHESFITQLEQMVDRGMRYDWRGTILGMLLRANVENKEKVFCSEMLLLAMKTSGYLQQFLLNTEPNQGAPGMMYRSPKQVKVGEYIVGEEWICPKIPIGYA